MLNDLLCVVSPHENGFWQADIYTEGQEEGVAPDGFLTGAIGGERGEVVAEVRTKYPGILIVPGVVGVCGVCGEEQVAFRDFCPDCGGVIGDA